MPLSFKALIEADATREQIEDWCRSQTQSYTAVQEGIGVVVARVLGKYLMTCDSRDNALTPHLALDGIWEPWVTMAIARHVKPGMRCMDVGSCYGYYAILMADLAGPSGRVQAWEPYWQDYVLTNASLNGLPVEVIPAALGTKDREMRILPLAKRLRDMFNAGGAKLVEDDGSGRGRVALMRRPRNEPWDFIKIDTEGSEADVWQALAGVRESPSLTVCMEFTPREHTDPMAFVELLMNDGFDLGTVGHDGVPRACSLDEALTPDTGGFRMLWLTRKKI